MKSAPLAASACSIAARPLGRDVRVLVPHREAAAAADLAAALQRAGIGAKLAVVDAGAVEADRGLHVGLQRGAEQVATDPDNPAAPTSPGATRGSRAR